MAAKALSTRNIEGIGEGSLAGALAMGFARVVRYFWGWLRGGEKVDEDLVRREDIAEERAEEVADRDLEGIDTEDGPEQVVTLVRARADEINAYLDAMSLGWYQIAIVFFIGCMMPTISESARAAFICFRLLVEKTNETSQDASSLELC